MSLWFVMLVSFVAAGLMVLEWKALRWSRLFALRIVWIALLVFIFFEISRTVSRSLSEPRPLHILVDRSDSVAKVDSRRKAFESSIVELKQRARDNGAPVNIISFGTSLKREGDSIVWGDEETRADSVQSALSEASDEAIVMISDGQWQGNLVSRSPVTVLLHDTSSEKDLWVFSQHQKVTAFLKNKNRQ